MIDSIRQAEGDCCDVAIVGAGPVGLFLAARLHQLGWSCVILERRTAPSMQTRAIGIHPPSLELLDTMGLADELVRRGLCVRMGRAYTRGRCLGTLRFYTCPPPFNFVLTVPQYETEALLHRHVVANLPSCLRAGAEVVGVAEDAAGVTIRYRADGERVLRASFLVGCDGKDSVVRRLAGLAFEGRPYGDSFVMGDFADRTPYAEEARIFMDERGFIESFPLPGRLRRWVVRTSAFTPEPVEADFRATVRERTGQDLAGCLASPLIPFGVQRFVAERFAKGRVLLAGDAAHVMSPIGGQGMNAGWMDAWDAADALHRILAGRASHEDELRAYDGRARHRAKSAIRRAQRNMAIGRTHAFGLRSALVAAALHLPIQRTLARYFTMRGL